MDKGHRTNFVSLTEGRELGDTIRCNVIYEDCLQSVLVYLRGWCGVQEYRRNDGIPYHTVEG